MIKLPFGMGLDNLLAGLVSDQIPNVCRGMFIDLLSNVSVQEASEWVVANVSLWDKVEKEHQDQIITYAPRITNWDWLTSEWLIQSLANDHPGLASLFLGWKKGRTWLNRQIVDIKKEAGIEVPE